MGSTQVVVVAEQLVVLQRHKEHTLLERLFYIFTDADSQCGLDFHKSGWAGGGLGSTASSCMTVLFGSDNMSGYRPIEQQLVWQVALVRNVCLFSKWSSST